MNAVTLKECPCCGGKAKYVEDEMSTPLGTDYYLYICCDSCGIRTPKQFYSLNNAEGADAFLRALRLWNRRCNNGSNY